MTALFGSRRRAEAFAARADEPIGGGRSIPGNSAPRLDPETDALLGLVSALRVLGSSDDQATPGTAFSLDLRERLVTQAATVLVAQRPDAGSESTRASAAQPSPGSTTRGWAKGKRRFATATATVAILMGGTAGMASAAQDSLPGQALYPVKRGLEKAAVTFSGSTVDRGRELLTQASGRLEEVQGLMDEGAAERTQIPGTIDTFNSQARQGADLLISSYRSTDDETAMVTLRNFAASSMDTIEELASTAPDQALTGLGDAAVLMHQVDTAADQACPGCSNLPALPASDVLSLANAGSVGYPGTGQDGGRFGATGQLGAVSSDPLAPLLPGLPAGQDLLGVPGAPAPAGSEGSPAGTGETAAGGEPADDAAPGDSAPGDSGPGTDPGTQDPSTEPGGSAGGPPQQADPTQPDPPQADPTQPDPPQPDPTYPDPTQPDPPQGDPTHPDPTHPDPPQNDPTQTPDPTPPETDPTPTSDPTQSADPTPSDAPVEDPSPEEPGDGDDQGTEPPVGDSVQTPAQP